MLHKCVYALAIGASAKEIEDADKGFGVCNFCHVEWNPKPVTKTVTKTTGGK